MAKTGRKRRARRKNGANHGTRVRAPARCAPAPSPTEVRAAGPADGGSRPRRGADPGVGREPSGPRRPAARWPGRPAAR